MIRKLASVFAFAATLGWAAQAIAVPIVPTDLDDWNTLTGANQVSLGVSSDIFIVALPPPPTMGTLDNEVFVDTASVPGLTLYTYTHTVVPTINNISEFNTQYFVKGFTLIAGWDFDESGAAGGTGTATDFNIDFETGDGTIDWQSTWTQGGSGGWDNGEAITFFFVSTKPPTIKDYGLINSEVGTAQSFAPIPEPGSIALIGSGLVGLYGNIRRRRNRRG